LRHGYDSQTGPSEEVGTLMSGYVGIGLTIDQFGRDSYADDLVEGAYRVDTTMPVGLRSGVEWGVEHRPSSSTGK